MRYLRYAPRKVMGSNPSQYLYFFLFSLEINPGLVFFFFFYKKIWEGFFIQKELLLTTESLSIFKNYESRTQPSRISLSCHEYSW